MLVDPNINLCAFDEYARRRKPSRAEADAQKRSGLLAPRIEGRPSNNTTRGGSCDNCPVTAPSNATRRSSDGNRSADSTRCPTTLTTKAKHQGGE